MVSEAFAPTDAAHAKAGLDADSGKVGKKQQWNKFRELWIPWRWSSLSNQKCLPGDCCHGCIGRTIGVKALYIFAGEGQMKPMDLFLSSAVFSLEDARAGVDSGA